MARNGPHITPGGGPCQHSESRHLKCNPGGDHRVISKVTLAEWASGGFQHEQPVEMGLFHGNLCSVSEGPQGIERDDAGRVLPGMRLSSEICDPQAGRSSAQENAASPSPSEAIRLQSRNDRDPPDRKSVV